MNTTELLRDLAARPLGALDLIWDRLGDELLNVHPGGHPNSPAWLLWHSGREIDQQVADLGGPEVWNSQGFFVRFGLPVAVDEHGYGHSAEQAAAIVVDDRDLLRDYLAAVTEASLDYLGGLSEADLDEVVDRNWDPPVTRGVRLVSVYADALEHLGQVAYVLGMPHPH
ncbi:mycothiol transferase [Propionibacteriaceae bacterium Y1923]|uniref:mycothiol transferase n=1 Tax=Aestuariimicrobium sp. Y1814 TaxID=3418742 RepID=UPI003C1DB96E